MSVPDMRLKLERGREKIQQALREHGTTILAAGPISIVPFLGKAAADAGVRMIEITHNGVALDLGLEGIYDRHGAASVSYLVPMEDMLRKVKGFRSVVGEEVYLSVGVPGVWTQMGPSVFTEEYALELSRVGADGFHTHLHSLGDVERTVKIAHKYGLLVDAYISDPAGAYVNFGIPAKTPEEVGKTVKDLEKVGADIVALLTGRTYYKLEEAGDVTPELRRRIDALVSTAKVFTQAEGGISPYNFKNYKKTGINILVLGHIMDDLIINTIKDAVKTSLES